MITPNENGYFEVDLSKVTRVRIGNQWTDIRPGSLVVGRTKLRMPGRRVILPGGLSYFFLDTSGNLHTGPYEHIQEHALTSRTGTEDQQRIEGTG